MSVFGQLGLGRLLRPFARVRREEARSVLLLTATVFLQLTAYYILKVAREPLIMVGGGGAEIKTYSSAGQVLLLAAVIPLYNALARRWSGARLVVAVHLFFIANLLLFLALSATGLPLGVPFYLWVGVFNVTLVTQFWAFANDVYTREQGERVFAILGMGASVGAVAGAHAAGGLLEFVGPFGLMPVAAGILGLCIVLVLLVRRGGSGQPAADDGPTASDDPIGGRGLLPMFRDDHYLIFVALLTLVANWVNTIGEYILDRTLLEAAGAATSGGADAMEHYIGSFRASFFGWVNLLGVLVQAFAVSRVMRLLGVPGSLCVLPAFALGGYTTILIAPALYVIAAVKAGENSLAYSLQNTARQALFLVTERDAKFKAKTATDTLLWRAGDLFAAGLVFLGTQLAFATRHFVATNLGMVLAWGALVLVIWRLHRRRTGGGGEAQSADAPGDGEAALAEDPGVAG